MKDLLIVVPYRNREKHLELYLEKTPQYFNQQNITYDILICELDQQGDWNAGLSCNSVINFINEQRQYKYIFIHHVDVYPVEGEWKFPNPKQVFYKMGDYGSCLLSLEDFLNLNGYRNSFWGWGGEDNDLHMRANQNGLHLIDMSQSEIKFDTQEQNHPRVFNGSNYANTIKNLSFQNEDPEDNILNFSNYGFTKNLTNIQDNIYHHIVVPQKTSPRFAKNDKVILTFSKGISDIEKIAYYVKSSCIFSAYEYDVVVVVGDEQPNEKYIEHIEVHGAKVFLPKTKSDNLFIDRFACYKEFLIQNPQYKHVLHTDFTDVFFQANPFKGIDLDRLIFTKENITIADETWNTNILNLTYGKEITEKLHRNEVICSGIIYAPIEKFLQLCEHLLNQLSCLLAIPSRGVDQPILNKLIYLDRLFEGQIDYKTCLDNFCINLHAVKHYPHLFNEQAVQFKPNSIANNQNQKYAIVHQFNRYPDLFNQIQQHYVKTYRLF